MVVKILAILFFISCSNTNPLLDEAFTTSCTMGYLKAAGIYNKNKTESKYPEAKVYCEKATRNVVEK